jgi:hypothetical protein
MSHDGINVDKGATIHVVNEPLSACDTALAEAARALPERDSRASNRERLCLALNQYFVVLSLSTAYGIKASDTRI